MKETVKQLILEKIRSYQRIVITRHQHPDGDAVGSTLGLMHILRDSFPGKQIDVVNEDWTDYVAFLGEETRDYDPALYPETLMLVLDTGNVERISNRSYDKAREVIKIDHHPDLTPYGDLSWVEEKRSSVSEMITEWYMDFQDQLVLSKEAALCLYTGIVLDSGRFRYNTTDGNTLRRAAMLLDQGIDTQTLYSRLYLEDYETMKVEAWVLKHMKRTENGAAYIHLSQKVQEEFSLTREQAGNTVDLLSEIKGTIIWMAFIDNPDGTIRARLRSRFVACQPLAVKHGGGGHAMASGGTLKNVQEMRNLVQEADQTCREYKEAGNFYL